MNEKNGKTPAFIVIFTCPMSPYLGIDPGMSMGGRRPEVVEEIRVGPFQSISLDSGHSIYGVPIGKPGNAVVPIADAAAGIGAVGWLLERRHAQNSVALSYRLAQVEAVLVDHPEETG